MATGSRVILPSIRLSLEQNDDATRRIAKFLNFNGSLKLHGRKIIKNKKKIALFFKRDKIYAFATRVGRIF